MPDARPASTSDPGVTAEEAAALDRLPAEEARDALAGCCGSERWVALMLEERPFGSRRRLLECSEHAFDGLERPDWLQAFAAHARIGASRPGDDRGSREQAGAAVATDAQRARLVEGNARYEAKFGHVFLIRAAGRDAAQILEALNERLGNSPERELRIAADQQREITALRLQKLMAE